MKGVPDVVLASPLRLVMKPRQHVVAVAIVERRPFVERKVVVFRLEVAVGADWGSLLAEEDALEHLHSADECEPLPD